MLDKVYYKNECEVVLYYTHRTPVTLYCGDGKILKFLDEFLAPISSHVTTLTQYEAILASSLEDTLIINLDKVA